MTRCIRSLLLALAAGLLCLPPTHADAAGFGAFLEYLNGNGDIDFDGDFGFDKEDYESNKFGVGFALDTNLAQDKLFNYRLTIGYQHTERDFDHSWPLADDTIKADGASINNVFGFGVWRTPSLRLWLGPSVRVGVDVFDPDVDDVDVVDVYGGFGGALGLNYNIGEHLTLGLSAGYQYMFLGEIIHVDAFVNDDETYSGNEHLVGLNFTVFFRTASDHF